MNHLLGLLVLAAPGNPDLPAIDESIRKAMAVWNVPGCAVVIVRGDRVVYCQGHGVRQAGKPDPIRSDTLFPLASCSKAFTTAAIAHLAEQGKLSWDDPLSKHLPAFRMEDPYLTTRVTLRDAACHRSGLAGHDLIWYRAPWDMREAIQKLRFFPLTRPFRTTVQYQNTLFAAVGFAAAEAASCKWEHLLQKSLLDPLEMSSTFTTFGPAEKTGRLAVGHRLDDRGEIRVAPREDSPHPNPALSLFSTATDLGTWLRFQLRQGRPLVAPAFLAETQSPQMVVRLTPTQAIVFPDTTQVSYALGWTVHDDRGNLVLSHGGAIDGFRVHLTLLPGKQLGLAVLANRESTPMPAALSSLLVDQILAQPYRDWHGLHRKMQNQLDAEARKRQLELAARREKGIPCPHSASELVGVYRHPAYEPIRIQTRPGNPRLFWHWREETLPLDPVDKNTFLISGEVVGTALVTFQTSEAGEVTGLQVEGRLGQVFAKQVGK